MSAGNIITLQQWAHEGRLKDVQLTYDGAQLTLDGSSLVATDKVIVPGGEEGPASSSSSSSSSMCEYTLASIFLYIVNPDQSLVEYRKACRTYKVTDPVKVSDKNTVLGYFLESTSTASITTAAGASTTTTTPPETTTILPSRDGSIEPAAQGTAAAAAASGTASEEVAHSHKVEGSDERSSRKDRDSSSGSNRHDQSRREKENRQHRPPPPAGGGGGSSSHREKQPRPPSSSSSDRKRERSQDGSGGGGGGGGENKRSKDKVRKDIDPEKLFSNLSGVVGKREIKAQRDAEQAKLHRALATDGFAVSAEVLKGYQLQTASIMAHEIPVGDSSSILKAAAGKDLSKILKLYNDTMAANSDKNSARGGGKKGATLTSGLGMQHPTSRVAKTHLVGKKPIILLPKGMTAPITLVNAYEFFANSKFVPRDRMMQQVRTDRTAPPTELSRAVNSRLGGGLVEYELMDNPKSKLNNPHDWDRVVAVVALGQPWQFKDWPGPYGEPAQLFGRTFGFYVGMEGDVMPPEVMQWSVTRSKLNRDKRGMDSVTYASFWNALDEWMTIYKPEMMPKRDE